MKLVNILLILFIVEIIAEVALEFKPVLVTGLSLKNVLLYLLTILAIRKAQQPNNHRFQYARSIHQFNWFFLIWVAVITVGSVLISLAGPRYSAYEAITFYKSNLVDSYLFFIVFLNFPSNKEQAGFLIKGVFVIIVITGLMTLAEAALPGIEFFGLDEDSSRPKGGLGEPNQTAAVLCLMVLPMISMAICNVKGRGYYIFGVIIIFATIAVTGSRGGILGLVIGIAVLMYLLRREIHIEKKLLILISSILGILIVWMILPEYYQQLLLSRFSVFQSEEIDWDHASAGRTIMFDAGLDAWLSSPFLGSGWRAYNAMTGHTSHNTYLEILVNAGPVALVLYLLIFSNILKIFRRINTVRAEDRFLIKGIFSGLVGLLVALMFVNLYTPWFVVWAFLGLAICYCYFVSDEKATREITGDSAKSLSTDSRLLSGISRRTVIFKK